MLDVDDVPAGWLVLDALTKEALVEVQAAGTVQPGRWLVLFTGPVEPVERSWTRGCQVAGAHLVDEVLLPWAEERMLPAILQSTRRWPAPGDTLGVLQHHSSPSLLLAVDRALKGAQVELVELRVADGLGGRGLVHFWGETPDVEAALDIASANLERARQRGWTTSIIRRAAAEVDQHLGMGSGFHQGWRG